MHSRKTSPENFTKFCREVHKVLCSDFLTTHTDNKETKKINDMIKQHTMLRRISTKFLFTLALLLAAAGARAADYVITYTTGGTTYYVGMDNNNQLVAKTTPDATCVWQGYYNGDYNLGNTRINIRNKNNTNYYLYCDGSSIVASTTAQRRWYGGNGSSIYYNYNNTTRYIHNSGSTITTSNSATNAFIPYTVTVTDVVSTSTNPTINGADVLTATGNSTYTAMGAAYQAGGYTNYRFNNTDHYFDGNTAITPANATLTYAWSLESNSYATVNNSGVVTVSSLPQSDLTLTLTVTVAVSGGTPAAPAGTTLTASKEITIQGTTPSAPIINASGNSVTLSTEAAGTTSIRYTLDGSDPTATNGTVYNGAIDLSTSTTSPVTIKAVTVRNGNVSAVTTQQVTLTLHEPVITVNAEAGTATITSSVAGATIYYTTDGSEPTTASSQYSGSLSGLSAMTTIKAIAVKEGWNDSPVASETVTIPSGVSGGTVTLFDYEDHNWTYYQSASNLPDGYPSAYLSSPDPRNVKITYRGGAVSGASAVAISALAGEGQNEMVYYKTLEKTVPGMTGNYPYTVISNPFSKRPKSGSTYYGFAGWKVVSGGEYIAEYADNAVLPLDVTIHFTNLDTNYTPNCTSAEVVFEAIWTTATVQTGTSAPTFSGGTYETNFWVLTGNPNAAVTVPANCTMTARYPDGTVSWDGNFTRAITAGGNNAKVEFVNMNSTGAVNAEGYTFTMGRGIVNSGSGGALYGCNSNKACVHTVKIESGRYASLDHFNNTISGANDIQQLMILGCDYDRAKIDNSRLAITGTMYLANATTINRTSGTLFARSNIKSGTFQETVSGNYSGTANQTYYFGCYGSSNRSAGHRYMLVEGGNIRGICGGTDHTTNQNANDPAFTLRVRGSENNPIINGIIYGAAENAMCQGRRVLAFTGGTIKGWIAGAANGTSVDNGALTGATFLYVGGNTQVNSNGSNTVVNRAVGGNVFAAGCGYNATSNSGSVSNGTNIAIADDAYVERGVYGGGSYGYTTATSNIYVLGGTVGGKNGGVNGTTYQASITGGVFGGACQNRGGTVNIYMDGGLVEGGVHGGSNATGTLSGSVTMNINGGQVGTSSNPANIHGGGYGAATRVSQNVDITLGTTGQTTPGVIVYGDVYGGSALGYVNGETATNTYHTNVTMNKGVINGSLYGGGLGDGSNAANVYGPVIVTVNGGSVNTTSADGSGAVYGCNNINGAPQRAVAVVINGTDPAPGDGVYALDAVYGGGNRANYTFGTPTVTVNNCDNSIGYVYGGGNAAHITNGNTDVTINGGNKIGNVFGGGNGTVSAANVSGNTDVKIYGGTIGSVYGGSNTRGTIGGTINVLVNKTSSSSCAMHIDEVYGGGNMAPSNAGKVTIGCTGDEGEGIGDVYGGANAADITGNVYLLITGGSIERVFGGNNASGNVSGDIEVNIDWTDPSTCGYNYLGYVYGAGNKADYAGSPVVNIKNGTVSHDVFGGGLQANVGGSVTVNMLGGSVEGALYGGGALAHTNTNGGTTSVNLVGGTVHDVYGGGLGQKKDFNDATEDIEAYVNGNVTVTLNGSNETGATNDCKVTGNIFGCNNLNGSPKGDVLVNIYKTVGTDKTRVPNNTTYDVAAVYGGGNMAAYVPSNPETTEAKATVNIYGCGETSIQYVYGGGNAASVPASEVNVQGCYEIGYVFGGGNGKDKLPNDQDNPGANVGYYTYEYNGQTGEVTSGTPQPQPYGTGEAAVNLYGGCIHSAFGGSNTKGNVRKAAVAFLDELDAVQCPLLIDDVYGGGNEAYMEGNAQIKLGCITSLAVIYGGSKRANVGGDIVLNITSGHFDRIFGGNNESGLINGSITVNIEETGCHPITIGELYGCGNQAPYITPTGKADPTVNVKSFTSIGRIFGGGLGEGAVVTGNPTVNINEVVGKNASYSQWEYPGKTITFSEGDVTLPEHTAGAIGVIGEVFGGGNAADVKGNTTVNIGTEEKVDYVSAEEKGIKVEGANILGNVYGGGNNANVSGKASVVVGRN